jgi:L-aminopeptidase/D-esterase-like protein
MSSVRSLLVIAIWFGLAIGVTELVSQMLGASQVGRTVPRKPAAVTTDMNVGELAVRGALSFASSRKTAA